MSISRDIPIKVINDTKRTDLEVLVFATNYNVPMSTYCAWETLNVKSAVQTFEYPVETFVEATYSNSGSDIEIQTLGPFHAEKGSTWQILQPEQDSTPVLKQGYNSHAGFLLKLLLDRSIAT